MQKKVLDNFKEEYLRMKNELFLSDEEIAEEMDIHTTTLKYHKLKNGISLPKRPRRNEVGLSEEMLQRGEANGIERKLIYKRVREYCWSHERAVTEPKNYKIRKGLKHDA